MSINLKYSSNVESDYKKLSNGRKVYIQKRADVKDLSLKDYLNKKYGGKL
jgi:hypothetical protein